MKQTFRVENVKCEGCATTLQRKLKDSFGKVDINLELSPREIRVEIDDTRIGELGLALKKLGYPFSSDKLGLVDTTTTKAKSFVSCAIGKMDS